jgi:uncharacterized protein YkwD
VDPANAEAAFVKRFNGMREQRELPTVDIADQLSEMAQSHAENMAEHDYLGHQQPDGATIADRYRERGLLPNCEIKTGGGRYYPGAENVAGAVIGEVTHPGTDETFRVRNGKTLAEFLMSSWMTSPEHRELMVSAAIREIGLGVAEGDDSKLFAALEFC